jgi:TPR repeat protein
MSWRGPASTLKITSNSTRSIPAVRSRHLSPGRACVLPLLFIAGLLAFTLYPPVRQTPRLLWSFLGSGAVLLVWNGVLLASARRRQRVFTLEIVLRAQHYVQACAHTSIFLYWGWYWRPVYESAYLIVAQLLFAYAFDMLLSWSRRDTYTLGFGPFPIILSTNLFLWFKRDWFYLQFAMIAFGFAAKELIRWNKDGRQTHIFNPSSFALAIFSLTLILTGATDITWGKDIAVTQFYPPHMYLFLFLVALPGQFLFGVTTMTLSAVLTTYLFGLAYYAMTGTYYFFDSYIPIAVFLGMHLLFTDPSTSPRTELGRLIFGALYGLSTIALYALLRAAGVPAFYDKLLQVPVLNVSIKSIDKAVRSGPLRRFDPAAIGRSIPVRGRNLAYMSLWAIVFSIMTAAHGVGDSHRGQWIPFWQQACQQDRAHACQYLAVLHATYCRADSGWSCNELGILQANKEMDRPSALASVQRGCQLGFQPACANVTNLISHTPLAAGPPPLEELPILLRGSKGPITDRSSGSLYARACEQGWPDSCGRVAKLDGE